MSPKYLKAGQWPKIIFTESGITMPQIPVGNVRLNYKITGSGPFMLFLPGKGLDLHLFDSTVKALEKYFIDETGPILLSYLDQLS